jgi:hypothetical protein
MTPPSLRGRRPGAADLVVAIVLASLALVARAPAPSAGNGPPRTILLRGEALLDAKRRLRLGDTTLQAAHAALLAEADSALTAGPFTVTSKKAVPPSGDMHDYMSLAPYWWPDSSKPNGLPYVRHDGRVNPESRLDNDGARFGSMVRAVDALALAYYLSDNPRFADRAATLVRAWFVSSDTRMNPNLRFGQAVRGVNDGRGAGIVSTRGIARVVDAVRLIDGSPAWTSADREAFTAWCRAFLQWLLTSENGREERAAKNNHGSWYDVQVAALALFVGDSAIARHALGESARHRIASQILADGREPLELARTRSLSYSLFNLEALGELAEMARFTDVDLWHYTAPSGASIRTALRFLAPYAVASARWPGEQVTPVSPAELLLTLRRAATVYDDAVMTEAIGVLASGHQTDRSALLYSPVVRSRHARTKTL